MNNSKPIEVLRGVDLFAGLDDELLEVLADASVTVSFQPGDQLIHQGAEPDNAWVIVEGDIELRRNTIPVGQVGPGTLIGDLSLLSGQPHSVDAVAKTAGSRVLIGVGEFKAAVRHRPEVSNQFIKVLVQRIYTIQALYDNAIAE